MLPFIDLRNVFIVLALGRELDTYEFVLYIFVEQCYMGQLAMVHFLYLLYALK